jgi:predicted negative regulator of RcsB-dependent stress response
MSDAKPSKSKLAATPDAPPEAKFEWQRSGFEQFLEQHFKKLLIAAAIIAVTVAGVLVYRERREEQRAREGQAFTSAETIEDYKKVIANYPGSVAAGSAQLMIANQLADNNSPNEAIDELNRFLADYTEHPLRDQAGFRLAVLTLTKGDPKAGLELIDRFLRDYPKSPLAPLARIRKGDALLLTGDADAARKVFEELIADPSFAGSPFFKEAEDRLAQSKLKPPVEVEFVPEPEPPKPPPATPASTAPPPDINAPSLLDDIADSLLEPILPRTLQPGESPDLPKPNDLLPDPKIELPKIEGPKPDAPSPAPPPAPKSG